MRTQIEEGSKGTEKFLRAYARAFFAGSFASVSPSPPPSPTRGEGDVRP